MDHPNFTSSIWEMIPIPSFPHLSENLQADVCIVGAGIAGLTTAYNLLKNGKSVVIIDKGPIGGGQTSRTTGHICTVHDDRFAHLKKLFPHQFRELVESHVKAVDHLESIIQTEHIDCDYKRLDGYLFLDPEHTVEFLQKELDALAPLEFMKAEFVDNVPFDFKSGRCLRFPDQGEFHAMKYLAQLSQIITRMGGKIFTDTKAIEFKTASNLEVITENGPVVHAKSLIVATNSPINDRFVIHTKQAAYRTYVIGGKISKGSVPEVLAWDTAEPYHYIRTYGDTLLVGGEDHRTGENPDEEAIFGKLEKWARERFPMMEEIQYRWSGQVMEPVDSIAFIGRNPIDNPNVYIVTGDSGNGLTHGSIASMLITDLITGRKNPWEELYSPSRKTLKAAETYLEENINTAGQYLKWIEPADGKTIDQLARGEGAIFQNGLNKKAIYRDEEGKIHEFSNLCTHLGGPLQWNNAEKTWDCPCHGSRYDRFGNTLDGPAISNMKKL